MPDGPDDALARAEALLHSAREANEVGRFAAADTELRRALELLGPGSGERASWLATRIRITQAWSRMEVDGLDAALPLLRRARRDAEALGDEVLRALTDVQEGNIRVRLTDWEGAATALGRLGAAEGRLTPSQRVAADINRGMAAMGLGDSLGASSAFIRARDVAARAGLLEQEFKARHNLACLALVDGDLPRSLVLMREADAMDARVSRDRARLDRAEVLIEAGLVDGARSALEDALTTARAEGHRLEEGEISLRLARCDLLLGDLEHARRHLRRATAAYRTRQATDLLREAELTQATVEVAEGHELPTVVATLSRRTDLGDGTPRVRPSDRAALRLEAEARVRLGDLDGAERRLAGLGAAQEASLAASLHDVLVRALLDRARGHADSAAARLEAGSRVLAAHQFQSASLDVRAGLALHGRRLAALDVERALAEDSPDGVLTTVERWRAVSHRINPVTSSGDVELEKATRELRRLRLLLADSDPRAAGPLRRQVSELEAQVAQREWSLAVDGPAAATLHPVGAEEARAQLSAAGATLVEFFDSGPDLYQVVVDDSGAVVVRVGAVAEVVALVRQLRRDLRARAGLSHASPMAAPLERATASSLAAVDSVLNPSGSAQGRVVVVPSRHLAGMPWSLMPSLRGRPVTTAPSLTRWLRGPAEAATRSAERAVAAVHGPGLARTGPEISAVLAAWDAPPPADVHPSTSAAVVDALATARVVHVAAHGTHEGQSPLFSSLRMADGPVFAHEFPRPVVSEHVVLSACDVGQFSTRPGDEPLGLAIALLSLGATSVLAAVAPVADDVAHDAMVAYHRLLAAGSDSAQAWAAVVAGESAAGVFCLYGSDCSPGAR